MNALAIIQITTALLELSAKYIRIAQQNEELSVAEETKYRQELVELFKQDHWKIEPDPS